MTRIEEQTRRNGLLTIILIAIICCAGGLSIAAKKKQPRSLGEVAFRAHCKTCHSLPRPKKWRDDEWPPLVARYGERANLDSTQIAMITEYVTLVNDSDLKK